MLKTPRPLTLLAIISEVFDKNKLDINEVAFDYYSLFLGLA